MSFITRLRKQKAVYWRRTQVDRFGKSVFAEPVEIPCRWDDINEEFLNVKGEKQSSKSLVYVGVEMKPGDRLMVGGLASDTPIDPLNTTESFEVRRFDKIPNIKATEFLHVAYL